MNCWHCDTELIWGGDHDIDEHEDMEYDIVTNLLVQLVNPMLRYITRYKSNYGFSERNCKRNRR